MASETPNLHRQNMATALVFPDSLTIAFSAECWEIEDFLLRWFGGEQSRGATIEVSTYRLSNM